MRTRTIIAAGLACLSLRGPALQGNENSPALTAIHYEHGQAGSQLKLEFAGEIRYSLSRGTDRLVLTLPGTRLATKWGVGTLTFQTGFVRTVTTGRAGKDSLVLVIGLREGVRSTLQRPSSGNFLFVDVTRDPATPQAQAVNPPAATARRNPPAARQMAGRESTTRASSSPVDIAALVRSQTAEGPRSGETSSAATPRTETAGGGFGWSDLALAGAALAFAVGGTITFLVLLRRRSLRRVVEEPLPEPAPLKETVYRMPEPPELRPLFEAPLPEEAGSLYEDQAQIARAFQRGKGELDLALALKARTQPRASRQRLATIVEKSGSHAQRRTAARKLGVGVGEVELAVHLKKFQHRTKQNGGGS